MKIEPEDDEEIPPVPGLQAYRLDRAPERDLWPGISARLPQRRRRTWDYVRYAAAASLLLVVGAALVLRLQQAGPAPLPAAEVALAAPAAATAGFGSAPVQNEDRALVRANLQIVDSAEQQLRHALEQDPGSESLKRLLDATQSQRRDLRRLLSNTA